jgi:hypothetical protein
VAAINAFHVFLKTPYAIIILCYLVSLITEKRICNHTTSLKSTMESIRIDATMLAQTMGKTVRIIGLVKSIDEGSGKAVLEANGTVTVCGDIDMSDLKVDNWYEFIGLVQESMEITALQKFDFGTNINATAVQKMVEVVHRVPELFQAQ